MRRGGFPIRIEVVGTPRTKGSLTPQMSRGKGGKLRVHLVESGEYSVPWKNTMIKAIHEYMMRNGIMEALPGPVQVTATFRYSRPLSGQSVALPYPTLKDGIYAQGDLDKLLRNLLDALTQSGLIKDDSLVVQISSIKRWAHEGEESGVTFEVLPL